MIIMIMTVIVIMIVAVAVTFNVINPGVVIIIISSSFVIRGIVDGNLSAEHHHPWRAAKLETPPWRPYSPVHHTLSG